MGCDSLLLCAFSYWVFSNQGLKNRSPEDVSDLIAPVSHGCQPSWAFRAMQVLASCTSQPHVKDAGHPTDSISMKNASPASPKTRYKADNQGLGIPPAAQAQPATPKPLQKGFTSLRHPKEGGCQHGAPFESINSSLLPSPGCAGACPYSPKINPSNQSLIRATGEGGRGGPGSAPI